MSLDNVHRVAQVNAPSRAVGLDEWRDLLRRTFPVLARPAEVCGSVFAQLLINDISNPFPLVLVDKPSSGKTIVLNMFTGIEQLDYPTDSFTPASLVSHASNVKRKDLKQVDLLPRIRYKVMIVRDLASFFCAKDEELRKALGLLTRVFDGEGLQIDSGVHGQRGYKGDYLFMMLAGSTPIPERAFRLMGHMGARLLFMSIDAPEKSNDELAEQNRGQDHKVKEREAAAFTADLLRGLWSRHPRGIDWDRSADPRECLMVIARCSKLLANLRGTVSIHETTGEVTTDVIEAPDRLNTLLYNLARGHAVLAGRCHLAPDDLGPVLEVTLCSAPRSRVRLMRALMQPGGSLSTSAVETALGCSNPTALKEMEIFCALGVGTLGSCDPVNGRPEKRVSLSKAFEWFASDECRKLVWTR